MTSRKLDAIFMLLHYGAENWETLNKVAKAAKVSAGSLRVWRSVPSFQKVHREIVWECADSFVVKLLEDFKSSLEDFKSSKESQVDMRLLVAHKISSFEEMGTALQHAVLWRILNDVLHLFKAWAPFIDRCDMVGEVLKIATPRPQPMKHIENGAMTQEFQQFVWLSLDQMHGSRADTVQQRQRHFAVKTFIGLKMAQAAYVATRLPQGATEAMVQFLADRNALDELEGTFTALYSKRLDTRGKAKKQ